MNSFLLRSVVVIVLSCSIVGASADAQVKVKKNAEVKLTQPELDTKALESVKLSAKEPNGLIGYLKQRTLSDSQLSSIQNVIKRMGSERFEDRVKATEEAYGFGPAAIGLLRTVSQSDTDPEVAYRAGETLKRIEKVSHASIASAVVRSLAASKDANACAAMLGFLPMADTATVEDDIRDALEQLAWQNNQPNAALVAGLTDKLPSRRGAAAVSLLSGIANPTAEIRQAVNKTLAQETDGDTKFRIAFTLVTVTNDASAMPELISTIPDASRGRIWLVEDLLLQMAGTDAPKAKLGPTKVDLETARDLWQAWWKTAGGKIDLKNYTQKPRTTGSLMLLCMDPAGWGNATISEYGADLRRRWRIMGINAPAEFQMLPNGNIMILEQNNQRITERTLDGTIVNTYVAQQGNAVGFERLANGHTLITYRHVIVELNEKWEEKLKVNRNQNDILSARRAANGETIVLLNNPGRLVRYDEKFKELPNPITIPQPFYSARIELLPNDHVLVPELNRVAEYDLKNTKNVPVWSFTASYPSSIQRLPNGNTLIVETNANLVKEVTPNKEVIWTHTVTDGMKISRADRR